MQCSEGDGPTAIVTGAAGAIGRAYCRGLAQRGFHLVLVDARDPSGFAHELRESGAQVIASEVDVAEEESVQKMVQRATAEFGQIDLLVNNAAYFSQIRKKAFDEITVAEWDLAFNVNVRGAWLCARAVAPTMKAQRYGKIVNTASMVFRGAGISGFAHYAASKAAIVGLTRSLARELGEFNICVNTISPDYIAHDGALFEAQPEMEGLLAAQRAIRRPGTVDDLVETLLFLGGHASDFITGQDIWVNGGRIFG